MFVENGRNVNDLGRTNLGASLRQVGQQQVAEQLRAQMVDHEVLFKAGFVQFERYTKHAGIVDQREHLQFSVLDLCSELPNRFKTVQIQMNEGHLAKVSAAATLLLDLLDRLLSFVLIAACENHMGTLLVEIFDCCERNGFSPLL